MHRFKHLPKLMKDAVQILEQLHNAPIEMALPTVLGVANFATQSRYNVDSGKYGLRPTSLFFLVMAVSGGAKSTIYKDLMPGITKWKEELNLDYVTRKNEYIFDSKFYDIQLKRALDAADKQGSRQGITIPTPPAKFSSHTYVMAKGTVNGIIEMLKTHFMVGMFSAEAGDFFNGHAFQGGSAGTSKSTEMCASLTNMWDGNAIDKNTAIESVQLDNRRVNMLFLVQDEIIKPFLNNPTYAAQGFTHRLLLSQSPKFKKPDMEMDDEEEMRTESIRAGLQEFHDRVYNLLRPSYSFKVDKEFELDLPIIKMNVEAKRLMKQFFNENNNKKVFVNAKWDGFAERLHENAIRLAATCAIFDNKTEIDRDAALACIELINFFIEQRKDLEFDITPLAAAKVQDASSIGEWIKKHKFSGTRRELAQRDACGFKKIDAAQQMVIINEAIDAGIIEMYKDGKAEKYRAVK